MRRTNCAGFGLAIVLAASTAAGCGGGDGGSTKTKDAGGAKAPSGGGAQTTGKALKFGQPGVVDYEDASTNAKSKVEVTPKKLEKGSIDDFKDLKLEPSQKSMTPYYVEVSIKNVGSGNLSKTNPTNSLMGVDERNESQTSVTFIGDFKRCDSKAPDSLKKGESYDGCLVFLVPQGGGSLAQLKWSSSDVSWKP